MSYFDWTPDLDTHIELVDEQHKILVRCINELHEANQRKDFEAEGKIIEDLIRYTVEHFSDEEKLMDDAGYPLGKQHKQIHQRFVDKVREIQQKQREGEDIGQELLGILHNWLFTHISHHDKGFIPAVQKYLAAKSSYDELEAEAAVRAAFQNSRRTQNPTISPPLSTTMRRCQPFRQQQRARIGRHFSKARQNIKNLKIWRRTGGGRTAEHSGNACRF